MKTSDKTFYQKVYEVVLRIPEGKVTTYGAIAEFLGAKKSARMVGWAMNNSHSIENIPTHRVVNRNGYLTGKQHFTPPEMMQILLENEGVKVENDQILDFDKVFWKPN